VSFSQGANNFPILPALHILFYLVVFLLCVPRFLSWGWLHRSYDGAYVAGMGALCLAALPAALGRCDPSHVILDGLGLYALAFASFAQGGRSRLVMYTTAYVAITIVAFQYSNARVYGISRSYIRARVSALMSGFHRLGGDLGPGATAKAETSPGSFAGFAKYGVLGLPYGTYGYEKSLQRYLWSTHQIAPERYMGNVGIYNEEHLAERLQDLARSRYVLVQKNFLKLYEHRDLCAELRSYLKSSFLYFTAPQCKQAVFDPNIDIARFIDQNYRVVEQIGDYLVLESKIRT
jgi:hypothetical protein